MTEPVSAREVVPDQPATDQTLASLIDEALAARQMLPPYERCEELNRQLRAAIGDLYLAAQQQLDGLEQHSRDWYQVTHVLADADETLAEDLGHGLLSAAIQLGRLAGHAQALGDVTC